MEVLLGRIQDVFQRVFDDDEITVSRQTTAKDIEAWDSLMHVNLMLAIEREFKTRFTSSEVAGLTNVGELADLLKSKLGK